MGVLNRPPGVVSYPARCEVSVDDDCSSHGICPICLANLCCPGGGAAASSVVAAVQRRRSPGLSITRLRPRAASAGIAAARSPVDFLRGCITTTRCGHAFHAACLSLSLASQALPRCPQCRSHFTDRAQGVFLPNEDVLDTQVENLGCGLLLGCAFLLLHKVIWDPRSPLLLVSSAVRSLLNVTV